MPPEQAFPLFDAYGEMQWVPGWQPDVLYKPADGWLHAVFRTNAKGEEALWVVAEYDVARTFVRYVRMTPDSRVGIVTVQCNALNRGTRVEVSYEWTALSDAGDAYISAMTPSSFRESIEEWTVLIKKAATA